MADNPDVIEADYEEVPEQPAQEQPTQQAENGQEQGENPETGRMENEQQEERDYFAKKEENINKTKAKLQALLEKLQAKPPKETIAKKILRIRIDRLRTRLNRQMEKFNIEYSADQMENAVYDELINSCDEIREKIDVLEDREEELQFMLEKTVLRENYRGENVKNLANQVQRLAPKAHKTEQRAAKLVDRPRASKSAEVREELEAIRKEKESLEQELKDKIEKYKEYKVNLKADTEKVVAERMAELDEQEAAMKAERKQFLAVDKPNLWARMKAGVKNLVDKVKAWNEKRKEESAERSAKKDEVVSTDAEEILNRQTEREKFMAGIDARDNVGRQETPSATIENPILAAYLAERDTEGFDSKVFIEEMKASKQYSYDELVAGMQLIDVYKEQEKARKVQQEAVHETPEDDQSQL